MKNPFSDYGKVVLAAWQDLDTPLCRELLTLWQHKRWEEILSKRVSPGDYADPEMYFRDAQAVALVRKTPVHIKGVSPREAALEKMLAAERQCYLTNRRFEDLLGEQGPYVVPQEPRVLSTLEQVRKTFRRILGRVPEWEQIHPRFGPGAVVESVNGRVSPIDKICTRPTTYSTAAFLEQDWYQTLWARNLGYDSAPIVVRGERFSTVSKEWNIDRTIGVGASLPVYYQLGVGSYLRGRLKLFGIDLDTGQALHRRVACEASRNGEEATVDLVSASDTICRNVVRFCASDGWYVLLDSLRSSHLQVDDRWFRLERFSSMGNGFTFELQTALFFSIASTALELCGMVPQGGVNVHVYGDDIIVPSAAYRTLVALLKYFGFTPNERKSFAQGPFRESCGGDFWNGEVVRPYYQKDLPCEPHEWIALANGLRRVARARWGGLGPLRRAWFRALDQLPIDIRKCRGPASLGDLVIHDDPHMWATTVRITKPWLRYIRVWRPVTRTVNLARYGSEAVLAYAVAGYPSRLVPRDGVKGYRFGRIPCIDTQEDPVVATGSFSTRIHSLACKGLVVTMGWWGHYRAVKLVV